MWKGLEWASDLLAKGLLWKANSGRRIRFWIDRWLEDHPLSLQVVRHSQRPETEILVRDMRIDGRGWDWEQVGDNITHASLLKLASTMVDTSDVIKDEFSWSMPDGSMFSVCLAYNLQEGNYNVGVAGLEDDLAFES